MSGRHRKPPLDRRLGEDRPIPRRDFLQGALVGAASALCGPLLLAHSDDGLPPASGAAQDQPGYYPPILTGLRGSHPGSFEAAHALRDGEDAGPGTETGESYDLVIVGAGISGLSAAHFFRSRYRRDARVLILDNHDDFGGHAKRNEFHLGGGVQLSNGGTLEIDSPRPYSPVAGGLLRELGIEVEQLSRKVENRKFYRSLGLQHGAFFDRETFGADHLAVGLGSLPMRHVLRASPLSARARADIERIEEGEGDYLPGMPSADKKLRLSRISYRDFLRDLVKADPQALAYYQPKSHGEWAVGIDAVSALDCWAFGFPGFRGMHLEGGSIPRMGYTPAGYKDTGGSPTLHFPDGNATIARLLVRTLLPEALPGSNAEDVVSARLDYGRLDRADSSVRIRLGSTVVGAHHIGEPAGAREVQLRYVRAGRVYSVRARGCVLACYNMMIPYLVPELPEAQKAALHSLVKSPLVYSSVALRNWQAFSKLGVDQIYAPGSYHYETVLNPKVDIGAYRSATTPDQPMLLRMVRVPCKPGLPEHEQNKAGGAELLATPFATFEHNIREQLARMLGKGGFDPARDIEAITVNRWPHGYAPEYNPLWDPEVPPEQRANVRARAPFGRMSIANSDSGAAAYTDSAIDQADRAVNELLRQYA
jgi:spermidine dehydrogenase